MFAQLVWACQGKTCYLVQQQDGSYQSVWNASPEQLSQFTVTTNKQKEMQEDTSLSALLNRIGPALL